MRSGGMVFASGEAAWFTPHRFGSPADRKPPGIITAAINTTHIAVNRFTKFTNTQSMQKVKT